MLIINIKSVSTAKKLELIKKWLLKRVRNE